MPSTYSNLLRLEKQADGENDTTWGSKTNTVLEMIEDAIAGRAAVTHLDAATYTLTTNNSAADEARCMIVDVAGALSAARQVICPTSSKFYVVKNSTTGGFAFTFKTTAGTGISVPNGKTMLLFCDGTNVVVAEDYMTALTTAALTVTAASVGSSVASTTSNTDNTSAASHATNTISVGGASGGDARTTWTVTGVTSFTAGIDNSDSDKWKLSVGTALGTNDAIVVTTAGEVTMPLQPAFNATPSGSVANITGDNTVYTVIADTEILDQNADYNNATGTFTAPVTGCYQLNFLADLSGGGANAANTFLYTIATSNRSYQGGHSSTVVTSMALDLPFAMSVLADMDIGDTAIFKVQALTTAGTKIVDLAPAPNTFVSGFLAC